MASEPRFFLLDDEVARRWHPFSLVRPAGELLFGVETLRARAERILGAACAGHVSAPGLAGFREPGAPPGVALDAIDDRGWRLLLNSRFVAEERGAGAAPDRSREPVLLTAAGAVAGAWVPDGMDARSVLEADFADLARRPVAGRLLASPWELMAANAERLVRDGERLKLAVRERSLAAGNDPRPVRAGGGAFDALTLIETGSVRLHREAGGGVRDSGLPGEAGGVRESALSGEAGGGTRDSALSGGPGDGRARAARPVVEPGVVVDTTRGPVILAPGAVVRGPARLEGPLFVGRGATVLGGVVAASSIGPGAKVRGEVESCVILGFSNKAHDGFLGHSVVGRWANLGAFTTSSDLKLSYGKVRAPTGDGDWSDTGLLKAGCLIGDHVRTGIGTLLNTGTVVGAGSSAFGGGMLPREVPPFSWGAGGRFESCDVERFLETAARVRARRGQPLDGSMQRLYRAAWEASQGERERCASPS